MRNWKIIVAILLLTIFITGCGVSESDIESARIATEEKNNQLLEEISAEQTKNAPTPAPTERAEETIIIGNCITVSVNPSNAYPSGFDAIECIESVTILIDGSMKINYKWSIEWWDEELGKSVDAYLYKGADFNNTNMYMVDDLGNRYDHTDTDDFNKADENGILIAQSGFNGEFKGWFLFPPAHEDSSSLTFINDDAGEQFDPFSVSWDYFEYDLTELENLEPTITPTREIVEFVLPTQIPVVSEISPIDGMEMILIPSGEFIMGNADNQPFSFVYLEDYWIDKTEVTNGMYSNCVFDGECGIHPSNEFVLEDEFIDHPAVAVDWGMANRYCTWANRRLPTEAEWEKAATGPDFRAFPWFGDQVNSNFANFDSDGTTAVGSYPLGVSSYGLLDMAGNVAEWTASLYWDYPYDSTDGRNNPDDDANRVVRGGGWTSKVGIFLKSGERFDVASDLDRHLGIGFRCATSQTP